MDCFVRLFFFAILITPTIILIRYPDFFSKKHIQAQRKTVSIFYAKIIWLYLALIGLYYLHIRVVIDFSAENLFCIKCLLQVCYVLHRSNAETENYSLKTIFQMKILQKIKLLNATELNDRQMKVVYGGSGSSVRCCCGQGSNTYNCSDVYGSTTDWIENNCGDAGGGCF